MTFLRSCALLLVALVAAISAAQTTSRTTAPAGYRIAGVVVDRLTGQPLSDATVVLAPIAQRQQDVRFKTGPGGQFSFSNLAQGKYSLGAQRHGYALQGFQQNEFFATAIAVGPEIDSEHLLFRLRPDASIRGTITDEQNDPAANISVHLYGSQMENGAISIRSISQTSTDDRGQYSFSHLGEGTYYIAASGRPWYADNAGYMQQSRAQINDPAVRARLEEEVAKLDLVYPLTFYSGALSSDDATPIHLAVGDSVSADMALQPVRSVHIRFPAGAPPAVMDADPGRGMVIEGRAGLRSDRAPPELHFSRDLFGGKVEETPTVTSVIANPDGSYEISGIAPGHYTVQIDQPGNSKTVSTYQAIDLAGDADLSPSSGAPMATVSGIIQFNGVPLDKAFIELRAPEGSNSYAAQIQKGEFQFDEPVSPGRYEVGVGSNGNSNLYLTGIAASGAKVTGRSVQISAGQPVHLAITASVGVAQVEGIAKSDGKPKSGVMILLVPDDLANNVGLARRDQSDSDGTFTLRNVVPGRYRLLAIENGWKLAWADPKNLQPYVSNARPYFIQPNQKLDVTVDVQSAH
jgi:hypothetical protein